MNEESHPKTRFELIVTDRASIERGILVRRPHIVISVRDPGTKRARIPKAAGLLDVLYLAFHDAEPTASFVLSSYIHLMTRSQAQRIWQFVDQHRHGVSAIVVHCEQGMSRSPAIAAALAETLGESIDDILAFTQPNQYVFDLVRDVGKSQKAKVP